MTPAGRQPRGQTHRRNPGPSSPNEPDGIFTANLKGGELANRTRDVIGGVDPHGRTHHAAVIDQHGRLLADAEFGAHTDGDRQLLSWLRRHGQLSAVGVEGTGTDGPG